MRQRQTISCSLERRRIPPTNTRRLGLQHAGVVGTQIAGYWPLHLRAETETDLVQVSGSHANGPADSKEGKPAKVDGHAAYFPFGELPRKGRNSSASGESAATYVPIIEVDLAHHFLRPLPVFVVGLQTCAEQR